MIMDGKGNVKRHLELNGNVLTVFNFRGFKSPTDGYWSIDRRDQGFQRGAPTPMTESVVGSIVDGDGAGNHVEYVEVTPFVALALYLEGRITTDHIAKATVRKDEIIFRGVTFTIGAEVKTFTLVVRPEVVVHAENKGA